MPRKRDEETIKLVSASELADLFGVHRHTVAEWVKRGLKAAREADADKGITWGFRMPDVLRFLQPPDHGEIIDERAAKGRKALAEAISAEMDLAERAAELLPVSIYRQEYANEIAMLRQRFLDAAPSFVKALQGIEDSQEAERAATKVIHGVLKVLSGKAVDRAVAIATGKQPEGEEG